MYNSRMEIILAAFGLTRKSKLPAEGAPPRQVWLWWRENGETVYAQHEMWINPLMPGPLQKHHAKRSTHRVMMQCSMCRKVFSAGRIHQHVCKH